MTLPVPSPRTWSVNQVITAAALNADLRDGINFSINPPIAVLSNSTGLSITPSGSFVACTFDTNVIDTYGGHSTVTNTSRYTAPIAGFYFVICHASFVANITGRRLIKLTKSGVDVSGSQMERTVNPTVTGTPSTSVDTSQLVQCSAGDYIEMWVFQNSGGALALGSAGLNTTTLNVIWLHA